MATVFAARSRPASAGFRPVSQPGFLTLQTTTAGVVEGLESCVRSLSFKLAILFSSECAYSPALLHHRSRVLLGLGVKSVVAGSRIV